MRPGSARNHSTIPRLSGRAAFARERRFTADAAHELRTSLTALKGRIAVALSRPHTGEEQTATLQALATEIERLTRLSSDLLLLARLDDGEIQPQHDQLRLEDLVASVAESSGAYGSFGARALTGGNAIWVAGGIGITPFLSLLRHLAERDSSDGAQIVLLWSVRDTAEAVYLEEIRTLAAHIPGLAFHLHTTATGGRLTAQRMGELAGVDAPGEMRVLLCGPLPMMRDLTAQLSAQGVRRSQIISEEFALR